MNSRLCCEREEVSYKTTKEVREVEEISQDSEPEVWGKEEIDGVFE